MGRPPEAETVYKYDHFLRAARELRRRRKLDE
jgi:hypothetical protein